MAPIPSRKLTISDARVIRALLVEGWMKSDVARLLGCNRASSSEVASGARYPGEPAADLTDDQWRARLAEIQLNWMTRMARLLSSVATKPKGAML